MAWYLPSPAYVPFHEKNPPDLVLVFVLDETLGKRPFRPSENFQFASEVAVITYIFNANNEFNELFVGVFLYAKSLILKDILEDSGVK